MAISTRVEPQAIEVRGRVLAADGSPLANALVRSVEDSGLATRSTTEGVWRLRIAPGRRIAIQAIGFQPETLFVGEPSADDPLEVVTMATPIALRPVRVEARTPEHERFEHRRALGNGTFITEEQLKPFPVVTVAAIRSLSPRVSVEGGGIRVRSGAAWCSPRLFVDGWDQGNPPPPGSTDFWLQRAKRIEIYTAAQAPPELTDSTGCGAIAVWTR
ncbi:MAG: carboxypeptidase-like regulatory domain-containing protein [Gemmatimonadaceae bacterium]|nr:carboxypeptidase-like regulatory domain-containing protein [Gemmatimonadaceae bacterium]